MELKGFQKRYLRGQSHAVKPLVQVGKHGLTDTVVASLNEALEHHELVKVRVRSGESKDEKRELIAELCSQTRAAQVSMVGHTVTLYRQHPDPDERKVELPRRSS